MSDKNKKKLIKNRFRGFLPVIIDIETAGFNAEKDALLEIAFVFVNYSALNNQLEIIDTLHYHIKPFPGANLDQSALEFNGIDPHHPFRFAINEKDALTASFEKTASYIQEFKCSRAVLVGHNPNFDMSFLNAAVKRNKLFKLNPFHKFTTLDSATIGALLFKQTVLARAVKAAKIQFDEKQAHSALYDATKTAEFFCASINKVDEFML